MKLSEMSIKQLEKKLAQVQQVLEAKRDAAKHAGPVSLKDALQRINDAMSNFDGDDLVGNENSGWEAQVWVHTSKEASLLREAVEEAAERAPVTVKFKTGYHSPDYPVGPDEDPPCRYVDVKICAAG